MFENNNWRKTIIIKWDEKWDLKLHLLQEICSMFVAKSINPKYKEQQMESTMGPERENKYRFLSSPELSDRLLLGKPIGPFIFLNFWGPEEPKRSSAVGFQTLISTIFQ